MFLGIEIGGTKLQLGLGRGDGELIFSARADVDATAGAEGIRRQIEKMRLAADDLRKRLESQGIHSELLGVAVGFGGPIDDETRTIIKSHQIKGWDNFPLENWVSDLFGVPAVVGNDADVAGLGEAMYGAGKGISPLFYITVGTGIGGGLIIDGEIYRGAGRGAGEIGHTSVLIMDELIDLEEVASGPAIEKRTQFELTTGRFHSILSEKSNSLTTKDVAEAARVGDPLALHILHFTITALTQAIHQVIVLFCPRRIVIGGGVSLMGEELFFTPLRERLRNTFPPFEGLTDIVPAALGEEVVLHGAIALAKRAFG